nr:nicotinate-nucleotide adenylyltransferase [uncultured Mediterraneibacter sp.]
MTETGVIHGRFQVLHLKHMEYLLAAKMRCKMLYVGITHPDISAYPASSPLDEHGTTKTDNPLTYIERYEMLRDALLDFGVKREEFEIIPFPISSPDILIQYAPKDAVYYMSICGAWDEEKYQILRSLDLNVEVLWRRTDEEKGITGTRLRGMIAREEDWQQHMPRTAAEYLTEHGIDQRIRQMYYTYGGK